MLRIIVKTPRMPKPVKLYFSDSVQFTPNLTLAIATHKTPALYSFYNSPQAPIKPLTHRVAKTV